MKLLFSLAVTYVIYVAGEDYPAIFGLTDFDLRRGNQYFLAETPHPPMIRRLRVKKPITEEDGLSVDYRFETRNKLLGSGENASFCGDDVGTQGGSIAEGVRKLLGIGESHCPIKTQENHFLDGTARVTMYQTEFGSTASRFFVVAQIRGNYTVVFQLEEIHVWHATEFFYAKVLHDKRLETVKIMKEITEADKLTVDYILKSRSGDTLSSEENIGNRRIKMPNTNGDYHIVALESKGPRKNRTYALLILGRRYLCSHQIVELFKWFRFFQLKHSNIPGGFRMKIYGTSIDMSNNRFYASVDLRVDKKLTSLATFEFTIVSS